MIRSEIKDFITNIGGEQHGVTPPISLASPTEEGRVLRRGCYASVLNVDERAIDSRYIYLRLSDIVGLRSIRIGDALVSDRHFTGRILNVNIKEYLRVGENRLELTFESEEGEHRCPGLFGGAELLRFNGAAIDHVNVKQRFDGSGATLDISIDMLGSSENVRAVATLVSGAGHIFYSGLTRGRGSVTVKDPLYWWPKGMGVQNLYKLTVNLYGEMEIEDTLELRVGIRRLTARDDSVALGVGDASLLPMGAVYHSDSRIDPLLAKNRIAAFINSAARVGMSALLVGSHDQLPPEEVLDLCDAHGIAVIREIRSSTLESGNEELDSLARLAHHPSIALYNVIYDTGNANLIRERMARVAPDVALRIIDKPVVYPTVASLPSDRVTDSWLAPDERNLFSKKLEGECRDTVLDMLVLASERFPYAGGFADFAYTSSVCAAELIKERMERARLDRGAVLPIYDGLGDTEVGICHSGMDAYAVWRALHYYSARFFAPLCLIPKHLGGGRVEFYISNERRQSFVGRLEYRIADSKNNTIHQGSEQCVIERATAKLVMEKDFGEFVAGHEQEYYLEYSLRDPMGVFSQGTMLFVPEKHFAFADPQIKADIAGSDRRFSVLLTASAFAKAVELSFSDADAVFFDNYIDLTSSSPVKISFTLTGESRTAYQLLSSLRIRSIYDTKRD